MKLKDLLEKYTGELIIEIQVPDWSQEHLMRKIKWWNSDWDESEVLKFYEGHPNIKRMYTVSSENGLYLELEKEEREDEQTYSLEED